MSEEIAVDILSLIRDIYFKGSNRYVISGDKIYSEKDVRKALDLAINGLNEWGSTKRALSDYINNGDF